MSKITKVKNGYKIKYIPQGYKQLFSNPYRTITISDKEEAYDFYEKADLIEQRDKIEAKLVGQSQDTQRQSELTLGFVFESFKKNAIPYNNYADKTKERYLLFMSKVERAFGPSILFSSIDYKLYYNEFGNDKKRNSCISDIRLFNSIGNWIRREIEDGRIIGRIDAKPIRTPKLLPSIKNALKPSDLELIYSNEDIPKITKAIIQLYVLTGCRISELCRPDFTWDQIDTDKEIAYIKNKGNKRDFDKRFEIAFLKDPHQKLLRYINDYFKDIHDEAHIYPIPCAQGRIRSRIERASKISGIKFTMHDLRDTSATILLRKSGNIYAVKEHLGHANVKDTQDAYADWINDDKIEASKMLVDSLSDLNY